MLVIICYFSEAFAYSFSFFCINITCFVLLGNLAEVLFDKKNKKKNFFFIDNLGCFLQEGVRVVPTC